MHDKDMLLILIILQTDYSLIPAPTLPGPALKFQPSVEEKHAVMFPHKRPLLGFLVAEAGPDCCHLLCFASREGLS